MVTKIRSSKEVEKLLERVQGRLKYRQAHEPRTPTPLIRKGESEL
jgi:hypothetical protein